MSEEKIIIIGAGVAGLVAAIELEKAGFKPTLIEGDERIGGRIKTDNIEGYLLDHGFQVLLTAYPEAKKYLDYEALDLKEFDPGALIFKGNGDFFKISDPLRNPSQLLNMLFSPVGTLGDKFKIFKWKRELNGLSSEEIFKRPEQSSLMYLKQRGFSDKIINDFFRPFFGGIFLENELTTSSRMLEFVFKMFSEGNAAVPSKGMAEIPAQLASQLSATSLRTNTKVSSIGLKKLVLENGEELNADAIIVATDPSSLLPQLNDQMKDFQKVWNLYFELDSPAYREKLIGLVPDDSMLINNFHFAEQVASNYSSNGKSLLSVSVNDTGAFNEEELINKVQKEIVHLLPELSNQSIQFIKSYAIEKALPVIDDFQYSMKPSNTKVLERVYLAGDYLLNGSINAAMISGRLAAQAVFEDLKGGGFKS